MATVRTCPGPLALREMRIMKKARLDRRDFLKGLASTAAVVPIIPRGRSVRVERVRQAAGDGKKPAAKIRFAVIGVNHGHITGQTNAVLRAGGELVALYAKEPDLT